LARPELGTKRICTECDAKFYDLGNVPYICPICGHIHEEKTAPPPEEVAAAPVAEEAPTKEAETETETDDEDEAVLDAPEDVEVISLDEAETDEDDDLAALDDEELPEVPDDDSSDAEESDVFLEEEEDDPNVTDLIGGGIAKPDES